MVEQDRARGRAEAWRPWRAYAALRLWMQPSAVEELALAS